MRIVFFGTPAWAVPALEALRSSPVEIAAVVTNPDRPAGRRGEPTPSPVKTAAVAGGLEVVQPATARDPALAEKLRSISPDVAAVVAYGALLPPHVLAIPRLGFVNLHFSLLPRYRGAAPVQRALLNGEAQTGVSIMVLTEGMDEGPLLDARAVEVDPTETAGELGARLAVLGAGLLVDSLIAYERGALRPVPQDDALATYAPKISDEEARIEWSLPARAVADHVRALNPEPGAWTALRGARLKIHKVTPVGGMSSGPPGTLGEADGELLVATGQGAVRVGEGQLAGRRRMPGGDLARGMRLQPGERVE